MYTKHESKLFSSISFAVSIHLAQLGMIYKTLLQQNNLFNSLRLNRSKWRQGLLWCQWTAEVFFWKRFQMVSSHSDIMITIRCYLLWFDQISLWFPARSVIAKTWTLFSKLLPHTYCLIKKEKFLDPKEESSLARSWYRKWFKFMIKK